MSVKHRIKIFVLLLVLLSPAIGFARYKFRVYPFWNTFKDRRRWELSGSLITAKGEFAGVTRVVGYNDRYLGDSTLVRPMKAQMGFGGGIGVSTPFASTGHISAFAFAWGLNVNMYQWKDVNKVYNIDGTFQPWSKPLDVSTMQISMPIALEWKTGTEALVITHRISLGGAVGAGLLPHINISTPLNLSEYKAQQTIGTNPFFKAELAFRRGIVWKLRAMYTMGNIELMNFTKPIQGYTDGPFNLTYKSNLQFSLILMPFKRRWTESAWYNDFDTYNWNERLD
ncbi:MAG: hypothetical protein EBX41_05080 [Chitinophagia bacterium]|nr:hypothetical protein [Chitinophagia bacterium]